MRRSSGRALTTPAKRQDVADASHDPQSPKTYKLTTSWLFQAGQADFRHHRLKPANSTPDDLNHDDINKIGEGHEAFPASKQDSTISGASVGDMNPGYTKEIHFFRTPRAG